MKKLLIGLVSLFAFFALVPTSVFAQATSPILSSGGPGGPEHRVPHDIAFSSNPSITDQNRATSTITNWVNVPMKRLVCVEAFNTTSSAKTHLGCLLVDFDVNGNALSNFMFDVPLSGLTSGTYKLVYTYQDSRGFWHQVTNLNDRLVQTTVTIR